MDDDERPYELAYAEAARALGRQWDAFESLRTRAGVLLSSAAITSSLLGSRVFREPPRTFGWLAIVSFLGLGVALLTILWPRQQWWTNPSPVRLIETQIEVDTPAPLPLIHRNLAYQMHRAYLDNEAVYERLVSRFRLAAVYLGTEVLALVAALAAAG